MMISVCRNCLDREIGCHGYCQKYLSEKAVNDKAREKKRNDCLVNDAIQEMRNKRRKGR